MSADADRRTLAASPRRLREARRDGQVPRARELIGLASLAAATVSIGLTAAPLLRWLHRCLAQVLAQVPIQVRDAAWPRPDIWAARPQPTQPVGAGLAESLLELLLCALTTSLVVSGAAMLAAGLIGALANGWMFAPRALAPRFERLSPAAYIQRLFDFRSLVEVLKSLIKLAVLTAGLAALIVMLLPSLIQLPRSDVSGLGPVIEQVLIRFMGCVLLAFGLLAIFDTWYQRRQHRRELRMTPEEMRRERRDDEGDPHRRVQRQRIMREVLRESPLERCANASHVICDTASRSAVALAWVRVQGPSSAGHSSGSGSGSFSVTEPGSEATLAQPVERAWLIHKDRGAGALAIIEMARQARRSIIEDRELCERIYRSTGIEADLEPELVLALERRLG